MNELGHSAFEQAMIHAGDKVLVKAIDQREAIAQRMARHKELILRTTTGVAKKFAAHSFFKSTDAMRLSTAMRMALQPSLLMVLTSAANTQATQHVEDMKDLLEMEQRQICDAIHRTLPAVDAKTDGLTDWEMNSVKMQTLDGKTAEEYIREKCSEVGTAMLNDLANHARISSNAATFMATAEKLIDKHMKTLITSFENTHAAFYAANSAAFHDSLGTNLDEVLRMEPVGD